MLSLGRETSDAGWGFELDSTADQHGVWVHLVFSVQSGGAAMRAVIIWGFLARGVID